MCEEGLDPLEEGKGKDVSHRPDEESSHGPDEESYELTFIGGLSTPALVFCSLFLSE